MDAKELARYLKRVGACPEAVEWSKGKTLAEAWTQCERADWMLWLAAKRMPRKRVVLAACACARTALKRIPVGEERPAKAIETAERWARGEATITEVRAAYAAAAAAYAAYAAAADAAYAAADAADAAYAAADAAYAYAYAADAAAAAAAYAAYAAAAAAAAYAAYAAADADAAAAYAVADAAAAAAYAYAAARTKVLREMADLVREQISAADIEAGA
jgi:hypothetical protein